MKEKHYSQFEFPKWLLTEATTQPLSTLHLTLKNVCPALTGLATWTLVDESGRAGGRRSVKDFICLPVTGRDKPSSHLLRGSWIQLPDPLLASN